jgi:hypothetical protein
MSVEELLSATTPGLTPIEAAALAWRHRAAIEALRQPGSPSGIEVLAAVVAPSESFHRLSLEAVSQTTTNAACAADTH